MLLSVGVGIAKSGALLFAVSDQDGGGAFADEDAVGIAEAIHAAEMGRRFEVEDFERSVVFRRQQQPVAIEVYGEMVEVA